MQEYVNTPPLHFIGTLPPFRLIISKSEPASLTSSKSQHAEYGQCCSPSLSNLHTLRTDWPLEVLLRSEKLHPKHTILWLGNGWEVLQQLSSKKASLHQKLDRLITSMDPCINGKTERLPYGHLSLIGSGRVLSYWWIISDKWTIEAFKLRIWEGRGNMGYQTFPCCITMSFLFISCESSSDKLQTHGVNKWERVRPLAVELNL